ncbi:hypothetical protein [Clostridium sp.]|uniref:hypothetical protein n=1 Tax=Clostridium sp. TaxID=1506 RepID=UPI0028FE629D|nr:hypothetical protein [Clostridium sp.]MDU1032745.1 hypothetical protein [Clostridium sp.]
MIEVSSLQVGGFYNRPELAKKWGYSGYQAISKGIVTPRNENKIILFITKYNQKCLENYNNNFDNVKNILYMDGEKNHLSDNRLKNSGKKRDEIYLFYREIHHLPFQYKGKVYLIRYQIFQDKPSRFILTTDENVVKSVSIEEYQGK